MALAVVLLTAAVPASAAEPAKPPYESFVVEPFRNTKGAKTLSHLEVGLPALLAERLARQAPLRFVGGTGLLPARGATAPAARWVVGGAFERRPDWQLEVRVAVRRGGGDAAPAAEVVRVGAKDAAARLAMEAAVEAFGKLGGQGLTLSPVPDAALAPFSRDPYALVLYGRGVAAALGLDGKPASAERAVQTLVRSLVIDPRVPETRRYLGQVHLEAGRPGHARAMWTYALDVRPGYVAALAGVAALDRAAGLSAAARERYQDLVALDPVDAEARRNLGELLSEAGDLTRAQTELERVIREVPGDLRARRSLALVLAARHAGAELVAELEELVKLDPEDIDARMDLGAAYNSVGKGAEAEAVYDEVLRRRPRHIPALKLAGDLARARGDAGRAAVMYKKLRFLSPQDPRPLFLLGATHYEAGNLDEAERMFTEGSRLPGMLGDAYSNLGAIALKRGKPREAVWLLGRAAKARPGKATIRYNHAMALYGTSRHADALNELRAAATLDPDDAGIRFFSGVVALRLGLLGDAEQSFREALRLDPRHEAARHNLSLLEPVVSPKKEGATTLIPPAE